MARILALCVLLLACGESRPLPPDPSRQCQLVVTPQDAVVEPGATVQFKAWWICPGQPPIEATPAP